jgi:hypothetical protein
MTPRDLRVDPGVVDTEGQGLSTEASGIPAPPTTDTAVGGDPLSAAFAAHAATTVDPVVASRPQTQEQASRYAQKVLTAIQMYKVADEQIGAKLREQMAGIPNARGATPAGAGAAVPGGSPGGTGVPGGLPSQAALGSAGGGPAAVAAQSTVMGSMGQLAGMPMQLGGALGAVPQAMTGSAQAGMQQISQMTQLSGKAAAPGVSGDPVQLVGQQSSDRLMPAENPATGAEAGQPSVERLPDSVIGPRPGAPVTEGVARDSSGGSGE